MNLSVTFTRPAGFNPISSLIRLVQRTPYSHVRLELMYNGNFPVVYEASGSKVHFIGPIALQTKQVEILEKFNFNLNPSQAAALEEICMRYAGVEYSILQFIGVGLVSLGLVKSNPWVNGEYGQICSELVARVLEEVLGINLAINPDSAGPRELYFALLNLRK